VPGVGLAGFGVPLAASQRGGAGRLAQMRPQGRRPPAGLALPRVWARAGMAPTVLLLTGGLLYTAGALAYHRRRPDPLPSVFGYHEVFHAFVCAAATCQFVAIAVFIA